MTIVIGYVPNRRGEAAFEHGLEEAASRSDDIVILNSPPTSSCATSSSPASRGHHPATSSPARTPPSTTPPWPTAPRTSRSSSWPASTTAAAPPVTGRPRVLAESYERIHRSNLVGMGILPLQFLPGESAESHGLTGRETYTITGLDELKRPSAA
jgi:hypothetical protein